MGLSHQEHVTFQRRLITEPPADLTRLGVYTDGRLVGYVALQGGQPTRRELGFLIGERRLWGRGFGTAAARAGLLHGFTKMHLTEIWAEALEANVASIAILRRLGMRETGLGAQGEYSGTGSRYRQYSLAADDFHRSGSVMAERFRKTLRGRVISSEGFSVRILGPTGIQYKDSHGELRIDSEALAVPGMDVVVFTRSIPDSTFRPRRQVLDNVARAFDYAGWTLELEQ